MRASRLLSILILLQMRGRLNAEALAAEFEVSVRTIYRDIEQLSAAGVPVYAERGRDGGFALLEGYRTRLTGLTPAESEALLLAGIGSAAADLGIGAPAASAQLKVLASLPAEAGAKAVRIGARFHLDTANWYSRAETPSVLPAVAAAVWSDARVRLRYESWKEVVTREVDPLGLVLKSGAWYLVAAVKGQPRTYRVSNIQRLDVIAGTSQRPARFDLGRFWAEWVKTFEARLLKARAVVRLSAEGLRVLKEISPAAGEAAAAKHRRLRGGWIVAEIPIESTAYAARQLLRLGTDVEVVEPAALRVAIAEEAGAVAAMYARQMSVRQSSVAGPKAVSKNS